MKARRIARELALLNFSQLSKSLDELESRSIEDLILGSTRTLSEYVHSNLKNILPDLFQIKDFLYEIELNSPVNLETPIESKMRPVKLQNTQDLRDYVDKMIDSAECALHAVEITEMMALVDKEEVREYSLKLIEAFLKHRNEIDELIDQHSKGWQIERLLKMDRQILSLAIVEINYFEDLPNEVAADEAVELAKKYSSEDSPRFVNGILSSVIGDQTRSSQSV